LFLLEALERVAVACLALGSSLVRVADKAFVGLAIGNAVVDLRLKSLEVEVHFGAWEAAPLHWLL
jgi:hypothetical protein